MCIRDRYNVTKTLPKACKVIIKHQAQQLYSAPKVPLLTFDARFSTILITKLCRHENTEEGTVSVKPNSKLSFKYKPSQKELYKGNVLS